MRRNVKQVVATVFVLVLVSLSFIGMAFAASTVVTGVVNEDYQIVAENGQVYEVAETEKGDEVVALVGKKVKVTGTVEDDDGTKVVVVESYEVLKQ